jgi:dCMP deaminase
MHLEKMVSGFYKLNQEIINMNNRMKQFYMGVANHCASMSRAIRLQVGCVIVKNDNIISFSWNGTPAGWDNNCEEREYMSVDSGAWLSPDEIESTWPYTEMVDGVLRSYKLKTKSIVMHAERNALDKLARSNESGLNAKMFITHSPCIECAKSIYGSGIKQVFYCDEYRSSEGREFLENCGILVEKIQK